MTRAFQMATKERHSVVQDGRVNRGARVFCDFGPVGDVREISCNSRHLTGRPALRGLLPDDPWCFAAACGHVKQTLKCTRIPAAGSCPGPFHPRRATATGGRTASHVRDRVGARSHRSRRSIPSPRTTVYVPGAQGGTWNRRRHGVGVCDRSSRREAT